MLSTQALYTGQEGWIIYTSWSAKITLLQVNQEYIQVVIFLQKLHHTMSSWTWPADYPNLWINYTLDSDILQGSIITCFPIEYIRTLAKVHHNPVAKEDCLQPSLLSPESPWLYSLIVKHDTQKYGRKSKAEDQVSTLDMTTWVELYDSCESSTQVSAMEYFSIGRGIVKLGGRSRMMPT